MNLVTVEQVTKQYSDRVLLEQVDLLINSGDRMGLIGRNGSGKSTLLRLLAREESPDSGSVTVWGHVRVRYLPQEPVLNDALTVLETVFSADSPQMTLLRQYELASAALTAAPDDLACQATFAQLSEEMNRLDGWTAETNAKAILTKLGIADYGAVIGTLSGGQRNGVAVARALLDPADLLIMDEPTNHIDAETITWLEQYLVTKPNALFMVTHDRYFLDRVANKIIDLDRRKLIKYEGNYSRYLEKKADRDEMLAAKEDKRRKFIRRELDWIKRAPSARGTKQKARKQRAQELSKIRYDRKDRNMAMVLAGRRLGKRVLTATNLSAVFTDKPLFERVDFHLEQGDRIGILGPNGAGKSTLLNLLAGRLPSPTGEISWGETVQLGYYDQQAAGLIDTMKVFDFIDRELALIETDRGERVEADQMLDWFLFSRPEQQAKIGSLSGGERRRLYLLSVLMHQPNVIFLDEPTNDLDIQTLQVLEEFLDHFTGSLVVVSHDRYFLDRNVDFLYAFDGKQIGSRYPTPYSNYLRIVEEQQATRTPVKKVQAAPRHASPAPRKLSWKEQRELEALEAQIGDFEVQKAKVEAEINSAGSDYEKLGKLSAALDQLNEQLETAELRWLELSEIADS